MLQELRILNEILAYRKIPFTVLWSLNLLPFLWLMPFRFHWCTVHICESEWRVIAGIVGQCNSLCSVHMDDYCAFLLSSIISVNGFRPVHDLLLHNHSSLWIPKGKLVLVLDKRKWDEEKHSSPRMGYMFSFLRRIIWSSELKIQILKNEGGALSSGHRKEGFLSNARESFTDQALRNIFPGSNTEPQEETSASLYKPSCFSQSFIYACRVPVDLLRGFLPFFSHKFTFI